jgi:cell fate (sporulation/competence/biofilm development) regulator YlbF (YheA/YmcA/DUF963 family)
MAKELKIYTNTFIGLCFIIDEYDEFRLDFKQLFMKIKNVHNIIISIDRLVNDTSSRVDKRVKPLYYKYQEQLHNINNHIRISDFLNDAFTYLGEPKGDIKEFHELLQDNRDEAFKALNVLFKLEYLDIHQISYHQEYDFIDTVYEMDKELNKNDKFFYVENLVTIPSYSDDKVKYITNDSIYEITLKPTSYPEGVRGKIIKLQSLYFNPNRLPQRINRETTYEEILRKASTLESSNKAMKNSVDLSLSLSDIEKAYQELDKTFDSIEESSNKEELLEALKKIREGIDIVQVVSSKCDEAVLDSTSSMDQELLTHEKNVELAKRNQEQKTTH